MMKCSTKFLKSFFLSICLYTKISEVNLSAFIYRLFHKNCPSIVETNTIPDTAYGYRYISFHIYA